MNLTTENANISIIDDNKLVFINCNDVLNYHTGNSWFGVVVAFRALEVVANAFRSANKDWDRTQLTILSAHPGHGVKDTIEYITHCISNQRFNLTEECVDSDFCNSNMQFAWWVSNNTHTTYIRLRQNFIPSSFNELLDRLGTINEKSNDQQEFDILKKKLANHILQQPLLDNFHYDFYPILQQVSNNPQT